MRPQIAFYEMLQPLSGYMSEKIRYDELKVQKAEAFEVQRAAQQKLEPYRDLDE